MTDVRTAVVIGGGVAGPITALALRMAGIEATVHEAYEHSADGVGAALMIAPNGLNALRIVGADDAVRSVGIPTPRMVMRSGTGRRLGVSGDLPGLPTSQTVSRPDLYRALCDVLTGQGVKIRYGKRLVGIDQTPTSVTARFADGSSATGDILVGADGIRSTVRSLIDPAAPQPRYTGLLGFGGWATGTGLASTAGAMHFVFGRRAFFGYQVADDGRTMWFGNLPRREPPSWAELRAITPGEWLRELREVYADDRVPAVDILRHVREHELVNSGPMEDLPTVPVWHSGRVVLVGDSAHATSPSSGQGASLAVESGIQLARCLRDLPTVPAAFAGYERLRRARVERVIAGAARVNQGKAAGPVARVARDLLMPVAMRTVLTPEKMFGWMHRYTIDWDAPVSSTT
jgi:FAD-dependent urate hydroxylase